MTNTLIHVLGKQPSIFRIPVPKNPEGDLVGAMELELRPRDKDQGKPSYWEISNETEERHFAAGFSARRENRQHLHMLRLHRDFLESVGLDIIDAPDNDTFACLADKHRLIDLASQETRRKLAKAIWETIKSNQLAPKEGYKRVKKGELRTLIPEVYNTCLRQGETIDLKKAEDWARAFLEEERDLG